MGLLVRILVIALLSILLFHLMLTTYMWFTYGGYVITYIYWWEKWLEMPILTFLTLLGIYYEFKETIKEVKSRYNL